MNANAESLELSIAALADGGRVLFNDVVISRSLGVWWTQQPPGGCMFHKSARRAAQQAIKLAGGCRFLTANNLWQGVS